MKNFDVSLLQGYNKVSKNRTNKSPINLKVSTKSPEMLQQNTRIVNYGVRVINIILSHYYIYTL